MGLLKDTYNITNIDTSGIESQMRRANDIEEKQNSIINNTKDRVDISLREYEELRNEIKAKTGLLKQYEEFIIELAKSIKQNPYILLKGKVVKSEFERVPYSLGNRLYVVWEFEDKDLYKVD